MAKPRKRYCPKGHDKDALSGSKFNMTKTLKGSEILVRDCRLCNIERVRKWKERNNGNNANVS